MRYYIFLLLFLIQGSTWGQKQFWEIEPLAAHEAYVIQEIRVEGNKHTKAAVVLRELSIQAGDTVNTDSLDALLHLNYTRLYNLNLFTKINFKVVADSLQAKQLQIIIHLKEQWLILPQADMQLADRNFNVWWNDYNHDWSRVNFGFYVLFKNVSGNLDQIKLNTHLGYTKQIGISYTRPYIDAQKHHGIALNMEYSQSKEVAYAVIKDKLQFFRDPNDYLYKNAFVEATWIYRPAYATRHNFIATYKTYTLGDTVLKLNPDIFQAASHTLSYASLAYKLEYNGTDNWNYPRKGIKLVAATEARYGIEGMQNQLIATTEMGFFHRYGSRFLSAIILRARNNFSNTPEYFLQSALGYKSNYVRGYEYYVIAAQAYALARFNFKYEACRKRFEHLNFKYLPQVPLWLYPKLFFDIGYASYPANKNLSNNLSNKLLYSVGMGLDIITAYDLKLRIELAYNAMAEFGVYLHANSE